MKSYWAYLYFASMPFLYFVVMSLWAYVDRRKDALAQEALEPTEP